jgi:hypothetical protein
MAASRNRLVMCHWQYVLFEDQISTGSADTDGKAV